MGELAEWQERGSWGSRGRTDNQSRPRQPGRPVNKAKDTGVNVQGAIRSRGEAGIALLLLIEVDSAGLERGMSGLIVGVQDSDFVLESVAPGFVMAKTKQSPTLAADAVDADSVMINPSTDMRARLVENARLATTDIYGRKLPRR